MFSSLQDFAKNQKKFMISSDNWSFSNHDIDRLKFGLVHSLSDPAWGNLYHNFNHLMKLGLLENENLVITHKGWIGFTNFRFYYNSNSGIVSIPISSIVKYWSYTTPNLEEIESAKNFLLSTGINFIDQGLVYKTLNGGYDVLNVEGPNENYLKNLLNEGEYLELTEEATKSIYKTRLTLQKKYSDLEEWSIELFINNLVDENPIENVTNESISIEGTEIHNLEIEDETNSSPELRSKLQVTTNRKYTSVIEDKFNKTQTITWNAWSIKPSHSSMLYANATLGIIWYLDSFAAMGVSEGLGMGLRLIESQKSRVLAIDYEYHRWEWMYLGRGSMKIIVNDGEVIELKGREARTHVYSEGNKGGKIFEKGYWIISEKDFVKICDSNKIEVRISGGSGFYIDFSDSHNSNMQYMFRTMYMETFDNSKYKDLITNFEASTKKENKANFKKGCLIAVVVFIILIIIGAIID
jgi:hypothetical protein